MINLIWYGKYYFIQHLFKVFQLYISEFTRGEGVYSERLPDVGEVDDVTDEDELNDSSQKPMIMASNFASVGAKNSNSTGNSAAEQNWRTNYSGSSSLSSFSYSPRSNNSSVSSHGRKLQNSNNSNRQNLKESAQNNDSLRSNESLADKNSMESLQ